MMRDLIVALNAACPELKYDPLMSPNLHKFWVDNAAEAAMGAVKHGLTPSALMFLAALHLKE
jgi:hypothetical protein